MPPTSRRSARRTWPASRSDVGHRSTTSRRCRSRSSGSSRAWKTRRAAPRSTRGVTPLLAACTSPTPPASLTERRTEIDMGRLEELRLITKVATLYHQHGLRQAEIAERLDLSQASVSRLLKRGESEGIVRITVAAPMGVYPQLEDALKERYGLKEVVVVDGTDEPAELLHHLGAAAAYYVETTLQPDEQIGISSWSETLLAMTKSMRPIRKSTGARVVQILGGVGDPGAAVHATQLTRGLASLVNGEISMLPAPGVVG